MPTAQLRFRAADRKEQIVSVAARLFAQQGFQGTTTKEIARQAGVTEALVFRHFASKEDLYWAVIESKIKGASPRENMLQKLNMSGTDAEVLAAVAAEILERRAKDQTLSRLLLYSALENHRLSQRFFRTYAAGLYEVLAGYIRRRVADGAFRAVDPLLAARGFMGMVIYHSWVQELFGGKRYQKFSVQQVSQTLAGIWLHGMLELTPSHAGAKGRISKNGNQRNGNNGNHKGYQEQSFGPQIS
jgi:AcrR family transcriptional regulator